MVHAPQELDRFQVFTPAMLVGNPLPGSAAVVPVEHGRHRIHPQAVHAKTLQPIQRIAHQKVANLGPAEVVDQRVPVLVKAFFGIGVFIQMGAVELRQAMRVAWKVGRHPVQNHPQTGIVGSVYKILKVFRRAKASGGRKQAQRLVPPRPVKRVLADRQQLQVGEPHVARIRHQRFSQLAVVEPAPAVGLAPGT